VRIHKSSIEAFAVEVTEGRPLDAIPPFVYMQVVQRRRTTSVSTGGVLSVVELDDTVAGWNKEADLWNGVVLSARVQTDSWTRSRSCGGKARI
jgi:hypothetical protein